MYIEFIGIPGAGKTTITEQTSALFKKNGIDCVTRASFFGPEKKKLKKLWWSLLHPRYLDLRALILWLRLSYRGKLEVLKTATRIHEYQKLRYQLRKTRGKTMAVWDNGFVQWFSNHVLVGVLNEEAAVDFIKKRLPINTLLVFISTPVEESVQRMHEREARLRTTRGIVGWTPSATEVEEKQAAFAQSEHTQKSLIKTLATRGVHTLILDGTRPPQENARFVYEKVLLH